MRPAAFALLSALSCLPAAAQDAPRVASAGPEGRLDSMEQANEVRIVFSEPMVALGRIPERVEAPFVRITPALPGRFRWSGTTTLIYTPEPGAVKHATRYEVTVDASAVSARGRRLGAQASFAFTTPVLKLLDVQWYRRDGRYDRPVVMALRFNQPVSAATLAHLAFEKAPHAFEPPATPDALEHARTVDPTAPAAFAAKVEAARAAAAATGPVAVRPAKDWDKTRFPPSPDLLVVETAEVPPPDTHVRYVVRAGARGVEGTETRETDDAGTLELEPTFFVDGFRCRAGCDPDAYNPLRLRGRVRVPQARRSIAALDVTGGGPGTALARARAPQADDGTEIAEDDAYDDSGHVTLEDAGFPPQPARTYAVVVSPGLTAADGQTLGYGWAGVVEHWHRRTLVSFGGGHGVWESGGGSILPFHARNLQDVRQWLKPLSASELMPALRTLSTGSFDVSPGGPGTRRRLTLRPDAIESVGFDLEPALSPEGRGIAWAALREGTPIARARQSETPPVQASVVQVTNLGLTVKDSPQNTLVLVTRLDDGAPVEGAAVSIRTLENAVAWSGTTGADGIALAPRTATLRDPEREWDFRFVVIAEKDGDVAYVGSDWNEGIAPWMFGLPLDLREARELLRGTVFSDRGVYRLGEEVHLKAILRDDTPTGIALLPAGTAVAVVLKDSQGNAVDTRTLALNDWSSGEWTVTLPRDGPLGHYEVSAAVAGRRDPVVGRFLVAAYRRPDFRVDVELGGESALAGVGLKGLVNGRYLFGGAMGGRPARWTYAKQALLDVPRPVADAFPPERWAMTDEEDPGRFRVPETILEREAALGPDGQLALDLETDLRAGRPYEYRLDAEVTDVSRQAIAGRARFRVDPAPWYAGLKRPPFFVDKARGLDTEVVAADLAGRPAAGVAVEVTLTQIQWHAVRRAEGGGFYTWESERREVPGGRWEVTTAAEPVPLHVPLPSGGYFVLRATAKDAEGRSTTSSTSFYALGPGFTAWERHDHNRIDLVPEKKRYRPGEVARILVKSPWETATALVTTEREGIRTHRTFRLASTQETVAVPVPEDAIPNLYVSVVLIKGRTGAFWPDDSSDPGKPAFRVGYAQLEVDDASRRLSVAVTSDREEYRPAARAKVSVAVKDAASAAAPSEVTLWAVDYGVLSLTAYRTPDVLPSVYVAKALQVMTQDSRLNIVSRRVTVAKGGDEGGGGGAGGGEDADMRRDFRVLAFWLGSVATDASGRASAEVTLPESLTTYRIMAVAGDRASRFGWAEREIRTSKPVLLKPAFPRFMAVGDTAHFGAVVHSLLADRGAAIVTMRSLDPAILEVTGEARRTVEVPAKGAAEVRFDARARAVGRARIQMTAKLRGETDAFEEVIPVEVLVSPETVAAYGQTQDVARETVAVPGGVVPGFGGLHLETASTALVGLGEGARYLVEYPYGCAEQRASATLALVLSADLGGAFRLPGVDAARAKTAAAAAYDELEGFQCPGGGFAFWKGQCDSVSPYLTSWVLHVMDRGRRLGYPVDAAVEARGLEYLQAQLAEGAPQDDGWWPAYTAWQAFAAKVLAEGGKPQDSHVTRLFGRLDRMPVFAMTYLLDAMAAAGERGERPAELLRRIRNAVLPEGGSAHVQELSDPYLLWFWNSNVRSTALVLGTLVRNAPDDPLVPRLVRWLLAVRKDGRWDDTQENATALAALVDYYRKYEAEPPDFRAVVELGRRTLAASEFRGRSTTAQVKDVAMPEVAAAAGGEAVDLTFRKEGAGTLHYMARLRYASNAPVLPGLDQGFSVRREYRRASASGVEVPGPAATSFAAGDVVRVTLTLVVPKERRYVAVTDPLPAGFEAVETLFATTAADLARDRVVGGEGGDWTDWWMRGGFDRVERHDDRVLLFATRLGEGEHVFSYAARATTSGVFRTAPAHAEEMYEPEVFGRTPTDTVTVAR